MNVIILTLALFALSALAEGQPAKAAAAQMLPEQLSAEKWFVGNWICEGTQHASPMGPGVKFTDRFSFEMALGGSWLIYHIDQLKGPVKGKQTLIGSITWDANAKVHVRRDMNIGGSRVDVTSPGWDGDKLVFTGYMITGDEKLPVKHIFTRKSDAAYDSALEVTGADGKPTQWEEESCKKVSGARAMTPNPQAEQREWRLASFPERGQETDPFERWHSTEADVRFDQELCGSILESIAAHHVKSTVMSPGIIGCAHEEGVHYPLGQERQACPYWANEDRWTGEVIQ